LNTSAQILKQKAGGEKLFTQIKQVMFIESFRLAVPNRNYPSRNLVSAVNMSAALFQVSLRSFYLGYQLSAALTTLIYLMLLGSFEYYKTSLLFWEAY